ncbi:MAG: PPOX class F420-dependent oxidoreductase [Chloroflexi bacterium]|nr:PPOX class F420-dependent oxidoreductase [Chloroflexota bacterium]MBV9600514.1 PPOX class F420-dependent oxidoreductase [Chloroflexota bacterium]
MPLSDSLITPQLEQLLKEPSYAQIATLMPDGSPQVTQVWVDTDGTYVIVNSVATHQKVRNIRRDPRVAINVHDPSKPFRVANIRGRVVEITVDGADQHIDQLARKYMGADAYPFRRPGQQRVVLKIRPQTIHSMGLDGDRTI